MIITDVNLRIRPNGSRWRQAIILLKKQFVEQLGWHNQPLVAILMKPGEKFELKDIEDKIKIYQDRANLMEEADKLAEKMLNCDLTKGVPKDEN